jgi:prepilin signal peptidase PulO-like enzyme (type II secretory pathway)
VFVLGACIGSFLNCYIYRLENKKSLKGRSFCPHCKHTLNWQDLFPVFSFLFLRGKCRYCKKKISWQYPVVELATGIIFLLIFNFKFLSILNLAFLFYVASALIIIFVYDLKHYIIPDKVLFPAIIVTFLYRLFESFWIPASAGMTVLAVIISAGFFFVIWLVSKGKWMGFGDVKLAVLMGLLLGLPNVLVALFLAFFFGAIIGVILMVLEKKNLKSEIPFGPFLIAGTFLALFWGPQIIQWYLKIFQI